MGTRADPGSPAHAPPPEQYGSHRPDSSRAPPHAHAPGPAARPLGQEIEVISMLHIY